MKLKLYFAPCEVYVPDELLESVPADFNSVQLIDWVNENWDVLVDPSLPTLDAVDVSYK